MNKVTVFGIATLSLATLLGPVAARAGVTDGLGIWEGSGMARDAHGADLGPFSITLTRKSLGNAKIRADGKVTLGNGQVIVFWHETEDMGGGGFRTVSSNGSGGGLCFANGMCQSYEERPDGHAFATTIVRDAPDKMRVLVTELDKGRAVRFMEQSLSKKP